LISFRSAPLPRMSGPIRPLQLHRSGSWRQSIRVGQIELAKFVADVGRRAAPP
jgi:hypothetical protein